MGFWRQTSNDSDTRNDKIVRPRKARSGSDYWAANSKDGKGPLLRNPDRPKSGHDLHGKLAPLVKSRSSDAHDDAASPQKDAPQPHGSDILSATAMPPPPPRPNSIFSSPERAAPSDAQPEESSDKLSEEFSEDRSGEDTENSALFTAPSIYEDLPSEHGPSEHGAVEDAADSEEHDTAAQLDIPSPPSMSDEASFATDEEPEYDDVPDDALEADTQDNTVNHFFQSPPMMSRGGNAAHALQHEEEPESELSDDTYEVEEEVSEIIPEESQFSDTDDVSANAEDPADLAYEDDVYPDDAYEMQAEEFAADTADTADTFAADEHDANDMAPEEVADFDDVETEEQLHSASADENASDLIKDDEDETNDLLVVDDMAPTLDEIPSSSKGQTATVISLHPHLQRDESDVDDTPDQAASAAHDGDGTDAYAPQENPQHFTEVERRAGILASSAPALDDNSAANFTATTHAPAYHDDQFGAHGIDDYYHTDDDDSLYVPSPGHAEDEDNGSRRMALYLAGAASISAICAAVYFLLPHERGQTVTADIDTNSKNVDVANTGDVQTAAVPQIAPAAPAATVQDAPLDDARVFADLSATGSDTEDTALSTDETELFASNTTTPAPAPASPVETKSRELTSNQKTLSTPDAKLQTPAETAGIVRESEPELKLVTPKLSNKPVTSAAPSLRKPVAPPQASTVVKAPKAKPAPKTAVVASKPETSNTRATAAPARQTAAKTSVAPRPATTSPATTPVESLRSASAPPRFTYSGPERANSVGLVALTSLPEVGGALSSPERSAFATSMRSAFDDTASGQSSYIAAGAGDAARVDFVGSRTTSQPVSIVRASTVAPITGDVQLENGWYVLKQGAPLKAAPSSSASSTGASVPANALLQRMATVTTANGDRWMMVGQDNVATGYVHVSNVTPASLVTTGFGAPYRVNVTGQQIDTVTASVPTRDYYVSIGEGAGIRSTAYRTADGDWIVPGANAAPVQSVAITTIAPASARNTVNAISKPAPTADAMSAEVAEILFAPQTLRRDARHGRGSPDARIGALLDQASTVRTITVTSPEGRLGKLSYTGETKRQQAMTITRNADVAPLPNTMDVATGEVQSRVVMRLKDSPAGSVIANAATIMPGQSFDSLATTTSPQGESWTLVGQDGVGYGFVPSSLLRSAGLTDTGGAYEGASDTVSRDSVVASVTCRSATYAIGADMGELSACLTVDGRWHAKVSPAGEYQVSTMTVDMPARANS